MNCRICGGERLEPLNVEGFFFPAHSYAPDFHQYDNYICPECGVVSMQPEPDDEDLVAYYNSAYRQSRDACKIGETIIDAPVDMSITGRTLGRVRNFHDTIVRNGNAIPDLIPGPDDTIIDFGAYSGMFLHGIRQLWDCNCLATDYNEKGIEFAINVFGFNQSRVTMDIYNDTFGEKVFMATLIHSFEHLREPARFLGHLRENILQPGGFLYVEVPNLFGIALCDPTHFFTYTKESLIYLMHNNGFEVLDVFTSGFPVTQEFTGHNEIQNLICLARSCPGPIETGTPVVNTRDIRLQLRRCYTAHANRAIRRQFTTALREQLRFIYYLVFAGILEKISPRTAIRLARVLRQGGTR